ncbi:hypothetical protein GCM10023172_29750 [Hymenobacter ginsengisoli]|uniref:Uncharacterized protein n=1 Tax=Hymenobacter ginsengisoli TaxID=1051626 RepID=A0ABP8QM64_9BACT
MGARGGASGQQRRQGTGKPPAGRARKRICKEAENQHELNFQAKIQSKTLPGFLAKAENHAGAEAESRRASAATRGSRAGHRLSFSARPPRALNL